MADINVGAISEALNNKADRDFNNTDIQSRFDNKANTNLSNIPSAYDYVVASQKPSSGNSYTWYRRYKSGWVEQGGQINPSVATNSGKVITLPVVMSDANYCAFSNTSYTGNDAPNYGNVVKTTTTTSITVGHLVNYTTNWCVSGKAA